VRLFLRLTLFLLALSCLTAIPAHDPSAPGFVSAQAKLSAVPAQLRVAQAAPGDRHGKLRTEKSGTATLEDGPEGERLPHANLARGYDADDQLYAVFEFILVRSAASSANASRESVTPRHPPCASFPTGPPVA
jgi:hypothetical protein